MITIVDYGLGNLGSILNMLKRLGHKAELVSDPAHVAAAEKLILPGVGAFDRGMGNLAERGLLPVLEERRSAGIPILGICLGAQLMTEGSEEGGRPGLGWLPARTVRFFSKEPHPLKVPAMGWHDLRVTRPHWLFQELPQEPRFYFVHSYHFECADPADVIGMSEYGYEYAAAFAHDNVLGVQFHPEKSHSFGMRLFDAFARGAAVAAPAGGG